MYEDRIAKLEKQLKELKHKQALHGKPMTWQEACKYMYDNLGTRGTVQPITGMGTFHSYAGIGILYTKNAFENNGTDMYIKV